MKLSNVEVLWNHRRILQSEHPLIHCITNPISINDCANAVLALGAKPIMAQHPDEVEEITAQSKALALNLGNFETIRASAMMRSAIYAKQHHIPMILDICGVACSQLRHTFAKDLVHQAHPDILKGNLSELKAIANQTSHAKGIDVGWEDQESVEVTIAWMEAFATKHQCTLLCTGAHDIITNGTETYVVGNGHEMMTYCTGTGCMLNVITASYLSVATPIEACITACAIFGISAEHAYQNAPLPGSFHIELFDELYRCSYEDLKQKLKLRRIR